MTHGVDAPGGLEPGVGVGDIARHVAGGGVEIVGRAGVDVGRQGVEHDHLVAAPYQPVDEVRPDEAGAAGHEHPHATPPSSGPP